MKETANGLPYPEDTDAPDGPAQIKALAEAIDQIPSALIADLAIIAAKIANEAVETGKIKNLAVTAAKLAEAAVTEGKLGGESVSAAKIKALAVTAAKIAEEAIETGKIKALAVTAGKLAGEAVETAKIKDGAVTEPKLAESLRQRLGITDDRAGTKIIATEESRSNAAFGLLGTADEVPNIVVPANALLVVSYSALWKSTASAQSVAAIFLNGTQLKARGSGTAFENQFAGNGDINEWNFLTTAPIGLISGISGSMEVPPETGVSLSNGNSAAEAGVGGSIFAVTKGEGGICYIEGLAAGEYDVSIRFATTGGNTATVKARKLRAWVEQKD